MEAQKLHQPIFCSLGLPFGLSISISLLCMTVLYFTEVLR